MFATNAPAASVPGMDLRIPPDSPLSSYALAFANYSLAATIPTNNATLGTINLPPTPISALGTLVEVGDTDLNGRPEFRVQSLRGAFTVASSTAVSGVTINATFWATFTLNLIGESTQAIVPEPASFLLVGSGLVGFGVAAARRRRASLRCRERTSRLSRTSTAACGRRSSMPRCCILAARAR